MVLDCYGIQIAKQLSVVPSCLVLSYSGATIVLGSKTYFTPEKQIVTSLIF